MPYPASFAEALAAPAYLINLTRRPDRLAAALAQLRQAGYRNVIRFAAVDGRDPVAVARGWAAFGNPPFSDAPGHRALRRVGHQGCFLSHLLLWQWIARGDAPFATIFEDDLLFHPGWRWLAPEYLRRTPPDWDILHIGHHAYLDMGDAWAARVPVQAMAAYMLTREGASTLAQTLLGRRSVGVIDQIIPELQMRELRGEAPAGFGWRVWNGQLHPLPSMSGLSTPSGLVFQRLAEFGSDI
ncbi:MAG TPA: glycosyltransferase family 25 protein [Thermomicrobiales bacterium]|nr:glycosyltransferase family 25 protein [Thermomicrobiales bacterium]